jgi:hypothetical protein
MFIFFWIFFLPGFYQDFFFFGSEVYRYPPGDSIIELLYILGGDIVFPMSIEVSFHHTRETIYEYVKGLSRIFIVLFFRFPDFLDECYDRTGLPRAIEGEFVASGKLHDDI